MKKEKLEKIISLIREQMSVGSNGFTSSADHKGPVAGFDPVMGAPVRRKKKYVKGGQGSRKKWLDYLRTSNGRRS